MNDTNKSARLLVIDDEFEIIQSITRVLRKVPGLAVSTAGSGADALHVLEREAIDAVLLDWKLPDAEGDELLGRIQERFPTLPTSLVSGHIDDDTAAQVLARGLAKAYLPKPFSNTELLRTVNELVAPQIQVLTDAVAEESYEDSEESIGRRTRSGSGAEGRDLRAVVQRVSSVLAASEDADRTLRSILRIAMTSAKADGGVIYGIQKNAAGEQVLLARYAENRSRRAEFERWEVPIDDTSIAGYVATKGMGVNIPDVYRIPESKPYMFNDRFDRHFIYRSKSMLALPLVGVHGSVIGVLQLINHKPEDVKIFTPDDLSRYVKRFGREELVAVRAVTHTAALALDSTLLVIRLRRHIESFKRATVRMMEDLDPATAGQAERVMNLVVEIARMINSVNRGPFTQEFFSAKRLEALRTAALIHDVGKLFIDRRFLHKGSRLLDEQRRTLEARLDFAAENIELQLVKRERNAAMRVSDPQRQNLLVSEIADERLRIRGQMKQARETLLSAAEPGSDVETADVFAAIAFFNELGVSYPSGELYRVVPDELAESLTTERGTLNDEERIAVREHVRYSAEFARSIDWPDSMKLVPRICEEHHERLDGSGYPRGKGGADNLLLESRILAVADVFAALTSPNRPYSEPLNELQALQVVNDEAAQGKLDQEVVRVLSSIILRKLGRG